MNPGEIRAAAGAPGVVYIAVTSDTARAIADAWEFTQASGGLATTEPPPFLIDVATINAAAEAADRLKIPGRVAPRLRVVGGDDE